MLRIEFLLYKHVLWGWWVYFSLKNDSLVTFFLKQWTVFFFFASHCSVLHIALLPLHLLFTICSLSLPKNCCLVNMASYNACSPLFSHLCVFLFFFFFALPGFVAFWNTFCEMWKGSWRIQFSNIMLSICLVSKQLWSACCLPVTLLGNWRVSRNSNIGSLEL